ncbi:MAG: type 1 glutamine amidotransferase [Gammaproteobacteria bacterium]|nr:type 1 glutamine amidotransferase [Gammaproteobacteria bacterium]MCI0591663.1 type 1 glutamine amidotransferase [Gammaproteobacteria bacterium]
MKPVLIFQHVACEGPGYLGTYLSARDIPYRIIRVDQGDRIPEGAQHALGLVFMGGPMSVNDPLEWIERELCLIQEAHHQLLPVLGHCVGAQLVSKALGGEVRVNPVSEIGWLPVERKDHGAGRPWLTGLPERFDVFHWHRETFSLPEGAEPILKSPFCENQAFVMGNTLALQCHVEMTSEMVQDWAWRYRDQTAQPSASVQSAEAMTWQLSERIANLQKVADILYGQWIARLPD